MSDHGARGVSGQEKPAARQTKHRQVFEHVRAEIESGRLKEGERLPSEMAMVKQFATSRPTIARALRDLQNLGLVERKIGSGTYVRSLAEDLGRATGAGAYAADQLFATLDPTVRRIVLQGRPLVLADTVGFVRDLPHELVAAFRSTLSEAREADLLLHVIDAADPQRDERIGQVDAVLAEIGAGEIPQLLVYNKIDRIPGAAPRRDLPEPLAAGAEGGGVPGGTVALARERVWISARDGLGLDLLRDALGARLARGRVVGELSLPTDAGRLRARLHALDAVRGESHDEHGWTLRVDLSQADAARLARLPGGAALQPLLPEAAADTL